MNVGELSCDELDALIFKIEKVTPSDHNKKYYKPSSRWIDGGPIIEEAGISIYPMPGSSGGKWRAELSGMYLQSGATPLIAAMRCYIKFNIGENKC